jgi:hypothetical protein
LACEVVDSFRRVDALLLDLQHEVEPHLRSLLARLVPDANVVMKSRMGHRPVRPPRMMSLAATLAVDLDASWWSPLWKLWPAPSQRGRQLERLITTEFGRVVEELVASCERSLADHVAASTEWTFGICDSIARSISRRRERLVAYYENLQQEIHGTADAQTMTAQQRYIATFNDYLDKCEAAGRALERIEGEIDRTAEPQMARATPRTNATLVEHLDKFEVLGRALKRVGSDVARDLPGAQ